MRKRKIRLPRWPDSAASPSGTIAAVQAARTAALLHRIELTGMDDECAGHPGDQGSWRPVVREAAGPGVIL
eukprot:7331278-Lingulodinium_polyedra.AAC.1